MQQENHHGSEGDQEVTAGVRNLRQQMNARVITDYERVQYCFKPYHRRALLLIAKGLTDEQIGRVLSPDAKWGRDVGKKAGVAVRGILGAPDRASAVALGFKYGILTWVNGELVSH